MRNEHKKLEKEKLKKSKAQLNNITPSSAATAIPPIQNNFLNNNNVSTSVATASRCVSAAQSCEAPAVLTQPRPSSTPPRPSSIPPRPPTTPPQSPSTPPLQATPVLPRTRPDFPINLASADLEDNDAEFIGCESTITVQDKLKEVIESGEKLDFASVVSLIKNHPWEESNEILENDDECYYDDYENDDYEGYSAEEFNMKLEEI